MPVRSLRVRRFMRAPGGRRTGATVLPAFGGAHRPGPVEARPATSPECGGRSCHAALARGGAAAVGPGLTGIAVDAWHRTVYALATGLAFRALDAASSERVTRLTVAAATSRPRLPTRVEPVKEIMSRRG